YGAENLEKWWSYTPPEVNELLDKDVYHQIAGQITYLKRFYQKSLKALPASHVIRLSYAELMQDPHGRAQDIAQRTKQALAYNLPINPSLPKAFELRKHTEDLALRERLQQSLQQVQNQLS
ncbi:MAG: hypothetical protein RI565_11030, partial [Schleiferiaceae bacterium]|nr:hypothetical protein [Schleiferiaceae bacterium]